MIRTKFALAALALLAAPAFAQNSPVASATSIEDILKSVEQVRADEKQAFEKNKSA